MPTRTQKHGTLVPLLRSFPWKLKLGISQIMAIKKMYFSYREAILETELLVSQCGCFYSPHHLSFVFLSTFLPLHTYQTCFMCRCH